MIRSHRSGCRALVELTDEGEHARAVEMSCERVAKRGRVPCVSARGAAATVEGRARVAAAVVARTCVKRASAWHWALVSFASVVHHFLEEADAVAAQMRWFSVSGGAGAQLPPAGA